MTVNQIAPGPAAVIRSTRGNVVAAPDKGVIQASRVRRRSARSSRLGWPRPAAGWYRCSHANPNGFFNAAAARPATGAFRLRSVGLYECLSALPRTADVREDGASAPGRLA